MSSNDNPNYQVSKTDSAPWAGQQPYLTQGFDAAKGLLASGQPQFYPNATYVPMSGTTAGSLQSGEDAANTMLRTNSASLYGLMPTAQDQTLSMARGDYTQAGNPYFQGMLNNAMQKAQPGIDASFAGAGRGISGARDAALADSWTNTAGNLAYQNYGAERQNQNAAIAASPGMVQAGMQPLQQLGQIGAAREGYAGSELQDTLNRYNAGQNAGWSNLAKYMGTVGGGSYGSQQTQYVPQSSNPWLAAAGGAGSVATILGSLFGRSGAFS
jgi:hypothetical protein